MTETKWTLPGQEFGPWESLPGGAIVRTQFRRGDDTRPGFVVADLGTSPLERRADIAALIAAAPDLYAALEMFRNHYPMGINPFLDEAYRLAADALSKARGES